MNVIVNIANEKLSSLSLSIGNTANASVIWLLAYFGVIIISANINQSSWRQMAAARLSSSANGWQWRQYPSESGQPANPAMAAAGVFNGGNNQLTCRNINTAISVSGGSPG